MFNWKYDTKFSFSLSVSTGEKIPFSNWDKYQSENLSQLSIINELLDNGLGVKSESSVEIDAEDILKLDEIDKRILGLPSEYPFVIFIEY